MNITREEFLRKIVGSAVVLSSGSFLTNLISGCSKKGLEEIVKEPVKIAGQNLDEYFLNRPNNIRYNKNNDQLYVAEYRAKRITILDKDLNLVNSFGGKGQGPGEFIFPVYVMFDKKGNIIVYDSMEKKISVFDSNNEYSRSFVPQNAGRIASRFFGIDSKDNIYLNRPDDKGLIAVCDNRGNYIYSFGETFKQNDLIQKADNRIFFDIDNDDNLYCAFVSRPLIRKYDSSHKLIFEKEFKNLPEIKKISKIKKKALEGKPMPSHISSVSVDDDYFYVLLDFALMSKDPLFENCVYAFDKKRGDIKKKIILKHPTIENSITGICFSGDEIYAVSRLSMVVLKYEK